MLTKIKINKETLEYTIDDELITVNHIIDNGIEIELEISKPDVTEEIESYDGNIY